MKYPAKLLHQIVSTCKNLSIFVKNCKSKNAIDMPIILKNFSHFCSVITPIGTIFTERVERLYVNFFGVVLQRQDFVLPLII